MRSRVQLDKGFLERLQTTPRRGVLELVWNAVDADADVVDVELERHELDGITRIRVTDNGHGMTAADAQQFFSRLGGSWKATASATREKKRALHGREGRGRFFAAALAGHTRWESVSKGEDGQPRLVVIDVHRSMLDSVEIQDDGLTDRPLGTTVVVENFSEPPKGLEGAETADKLTGHLAIYLTKYPVELTYDGQPIDPAVLQAETETYPITTDDLRPVELDVVEWTTSMERKLYLCDHAGAALAELHTGVQAAGFNFSAYLRWDGFASDTAIDLAELDTGPTADVLEAGRETLRKHFRKRATDRTRQVIQGWKASEVYPYAEPPTDEVEETSRALFDIVAFTARDAIGADTRTQRFSLALLKEALERDPGQLRRVLNEVLELDEERLADLNQLLDRTSLAAIVSAARSITDRLDFLRALEEMVFDPEIKGRTLERSQLHRILANETWIFAEEYHLVVDDEGLTNVLIRHLKDLGRDHLAAEPVTDEEGRTRIVDLMLARSLEESQNRREHLVVELKAPNVRIGHREVDQVRDYATAVAEDPQFETATTQWDFWIVSTDMKDTVRHQAAQRGRPAGLLDDYDGLNVRIWVKTWAELIRDARHRLKFVRKRLEYASGRDAAVQYLHERHREYVPAPLVAPDPSPPTAITPG